MKYRSLHPTKEQSFPHPDNTVAHQEMVSAYRHFLYLGHTTESVVKDLRRLRKLLRNEK